LPSAEPSPCGWIRVAARDELKIMAFTTKPTGDQVRQYVARRYAADQANAILAALSHVPGYLGDSVGWFQAAVLIEWEERSNRSPESLEQLVKIVSTDYRDFLMFFGGGPSLCWENVFTRQPGE
jgi:hypothetical protein